MYESDKWQTGRWITSHPPSESAVIASDIAVKSGNIYLGFTDRFTGTLIITGEISDVMSARLSPYSPEFEDTVSWFLLYTKTECLLHPRTPSPALPRTYFSPYTSCNSAQTNHNDRHILQFIILSPGPQPFPQSPLLSPAPYTHPAWRRADQNQHRKTLSVRSLTDA